jgi:putative transposase
MIDRNHDLSLTRQADLLELSRGSLYYVPTGPSKTDLELMREMDRIHTDFPFMGARQLRDQLRKRGNRVGRRHVARLMQLMGIEALYRKKQQTSKRNPEHPVFPYLLRGMAIERPNQVWSADITYIPMQRGFLYLFAVLDWATRRVLAWRLSNTLTTDFCIEAVREAAALYGKPEIFNTDQGSQFTDGDFVTLIREELGVRLSMDGKGCWRDNIIVERFWRSLKYEEVYLRAYDSVRRLGPRSAATSRSIMAFGRTLRLTGARRTKHTSFHPPQWRHNRAEQSLTQSRLAVQKTGATYV